MARNSPSVSNRKFAKLADKPETFEIEHHDGYVGIFWHEGDELHYVGGLTEEQARELAWRLLRL